MKKFLHSQKPILVYVISLFLLVLCQKFLKQSEFFLTLFVSALVLPPGIAMAWEGKDSRELGLHGEKPLRQMAWALGASLLLLVPFSLFYIYIFKQGLGNKTSFSLWPALYVQMVLIAFPEEFLFRGYLQTSLEKNFSFCQSYMAILETSFLFALAHVVMDGSWGRMEVFFPSLAFGLVRYASKSLWPSVFLHGTSNIVYQFLQNH